MREIENLVVYNPSEFTPEEKMRIENIYDEAMEKYREVAERKKR